MFGRLLGFYSIYVGLHLWELLPRYGNLQGAKCTLRPSLALSYIGSVTARHSSSGRQPNVAACYKEWNYGTFAEGATYVRLGGHHVGHRPTFWFLLLYYILRESYTTQNVLWSRASVCLCVFVCLSACPRPYTHTTARTRM